MLATAVTVTVTSTVNAVLLQYYVTVIGMRGVSNIFCAKHPHLSF